MAPRLKESSVHICEDSQSVGYMVLSQRKACGNVCFFTKKVLKHAQQVCSPLTCHFQFPLYKTQTGRTETICRLHFWICAHFHLCKHVFCAVYSGLIQSWNPWQSFYETVPETAMSCLSEGTSLGKRAILKLESRRRGTSFGTSAWHFGKEQNVLSFLLPSLSISPQDVCRRLFEVWWCACRRFYHYSHYMHWVCELLVLNSLEEALQYEWDQLHKNRLWLITHGWWSGQGWKQRDQELQWLLCVCACVWLA